MRSIDRLTSQKLFEVQRQFLERLVHHLHADGVVRAQPENHAEQGQPDELIGDGPAAHAQVPEQQIGVLVVAVQVLFAAHHVRPPVAVQGHGYADQGVPQETGGHQGFHDRLDGQPVAHTVDGHGEHRRHHGRGQHGAGLRKSILYCYFKFSNLIL